MPFLSRLSNVMRDLNKTLLILAFFVFTPLTLVLSVFALLAINGNSNPSHSIENIAVDKQLNTRILSASDGNNFPSTSSQIVIADARALILENYLTKVNSELAPFSGLLVSTADKYGLDYRLLPAIAIKESGACRIIPPGGHNCWGWGIHSAGTLGFDSYEEAIETVAKGLKEKYIDMGYITPDQIMKKYAHRDSTTWGPDVAAYMATLE